MSSFIAVDLGTSFIKAAVLDLETLSIKHIRRVPFPGPVSGLHPLFYEVDPQQIVLAFQDIVEQQLADAPDCEGLLICSQMHGLVLTTPGGEARSNCITWQDQRALLPHPSGAGSYFEVLSKRLTQQEARQLGSELKPSLPLCNLFWLAEEKQLPESEVVPASLPYFVLAHLRGTMAGTELSHAGAHGALNLETLEWHQGVIKKLGLGGLHWPEIGPFAEVVTELEIGSTRLPCYTPIGDHQCAVLGTFLGYNELSLNIGTASQVTMLTSELVLGSYQTRPFFDGRFMNTISRLPAGRSLNVLVDLLTELAVSQRLELQDPWAYIAEAAATVEETELQVELSFYASTVGDRGRIDNIQERNLTVGHLFRAAFQNMAENYYRCGLRLSSDASWQSLVFSGGLVQKLEVLQHLIQQRFQVDYRLSASSEDTLLGLLAVGLVASGRTPSVGEATSLLLQQYGVL